MRRFALPGAITLIAAALLAVLAFGVSHSGTGSTVGAEVDSGQHPPAPKSQLALQVLGSGRSEKLADLRGHVVMVEFFAGWCASCQEDAGVVRRAQRLLTQHGGTVLGVTYQDSTPDASSYMRQYHLSFPVLRDANGELASAYGVSGVPETFVINAQGKVIAYRIEPVTRQWVTKTLGRVLATTA